MSSPKKSNAELDKLPVVKLRAYAKKHKINLHGAGKKAAILKYVKEGNGGSSSPLPVPKKRSPKKKAKKLSLKKKAASPVSSGSPKKKRKSPVKKRKSSPRRSPAKSSPRPSPRRSPGGFVNGSIGSLSGMSAADLSKLSKPKLIKMLEAAQNIVAKTHGIPTAMSKPDVLSMINANRCDLDGAGCDGDDVCDLRNQICRPEDKMRSGKKKNLPGKFEIRTMANGRRVLGLPADLDALALNQNAGASAHSPVKSPARSPAASFMRDPSPVSDAASALAAALSPNRSPDAGVSEHKGPESPESKGPESDPFDDALDSDEDEPASMPYESSPAKLKKMSHKGRVEDVMASDEVSLDEIQQNLVTCLGYA